jgi:hypothetical protein
MSCNSSGASSTTPGIAAAGNERPLSKRPSTANPAPETDEARCLEKWKELWAEPDGVITSFVSIGVMVSVSEHRVTQVACESALGLFPVDVLIFSVIDVLRIGIAD